MNKILQDIALEKLSLAKHQHAKNRAFHRIKNAVTPGLYQYTGLNVQHYGSFTSKLNSPASDLDLTIDGCLELNSSYYDHDKGKWLGSELAYGLEGREASELNRYQVFAMFEDLEDELRSRKLVSSCEIVRARIPILKCVDSLTGTACDVAVGKRHLVLKSRVLKQLSLFEYTKFRLLVVAVKTWASRQGIMGSSKGFFNSYTIALMVIFHLQTRPLPVLPPLCQLFEVRSGTVESYNDEYRAEVLQGDPKQLEKDCKSALQEWRSTSRKNTDTGNLKELQFSFWETYGEYFADWNKGVDRDHRISTWNAKFIQKPWRHKKRYCVLIEDPFDANDNCARSLEDDSLRHVARRFSEAKASAMQPTGNGSQQHQKSIARLFGAKV